MKIQVDIDVFDDPKYCGDGTTNNCALLEDGNNKYFCLWTGAKILLGQNKDKHTQCKAAYKSSIKNLIKRLESLQWMTSEEASLLSKLKRKIGLK